MKKFVMEGKLNFSEDWYQFVDIDGENICHAMADHVIGIEEHEDGSINLEMPGKYRLTLERIDDE